MATLFGPCLTRLPSPASLLLEAWTNNEETKKLVDGLLRPPSLLSVDAVDDPASPAADGKADGEQLDDDVYKRRLAAFDSELSVLSTVVTAIKALKTNSSQLSILARSPGSNSHDMDMLKRSDLSAVKEHLLQTVFTQDEDQVAWTNLQLVNGIDTINSLEGRRRRNLDAIAARLGISNNTQMELARHRMDPGLDMIETLIVQNTEAQTLFRTVYLGTRICTICHHIREKAKAEFMVQLLNSLFPPYLMAYPAPVIQVDEVRALREKAYLVIMGPPTIFDGHGGSGYTGLDAKTIQQDLLSQVGIRGSWSTEIWPALGAYLDQVTIVQVASDQLGLGQTPSSRHTSFNIQTPVSGSSRTPSLKPALKNSVSSMSGQSVSTYGSSYGSNSDMVTHFLTKGSGLDELELQRTGLGIHMGARSNQASFDGKSASPLTQARLRSQLYFGEDFQMTPSSRGSRPMVSAPSASSCSDMVVSASSEDDVFSTPTEAPQEQLTGLGVTSEPEEQEHRSRPDKAIPFPDLKPMGSTATLKGNPALSASERTMKLIKSRLKSTESLFSRFVAMEPATTNQTQTPATKPRRPSKAVRFSEEETCDSTKPFALAERSIDDIMAHGTSTPKSTGRNVEPFVPSDPWQYTRFYLLEKVKAEKDGRGCALPSPPTEWFVDSEHNAGQQPIFLAKPDRDAYNKFVAMATAPTAERLPLELQPKAPQPAARNKENAEPSRRTARPLTFFRKKSISTMDENRPASSAAMRRADYGANNQANDDELLEEDEHPASLGRFASPRLGKLAFEMATSESRKNLDLDVKLFQRQSLLLAAKKQIEGDNLKRLKQLYGNDEPALLSKVGEEAGEKDTEPSGCYPHPGEPVTLGSQARVPSRTSSISAGSSMNQFFDVGDSLGAGSGPAAQKQVGFPSPRRTSRRKHMRSITQPLNTLNDAASVSSSGFSLRMAFRSREAPSTSAGGSISSGMGGHAKENNDGKRVHATMEDFSLPRVPPALEGHCTLPPEESKELRRKRDLWFREQTDTGDQRRDEVTAQPRTPQKPRHHHHHHHHRQQFLKKQRKLTESASPERKAVVLPDTMPPPPSTVAKAWTSLKRGASRMLVPRKSTMDLREVAEKRAASAPMPSAPMSSDQNSLSGDSLGKTAEGIGEESHDGKAKETTPADVMLPLSPVVGQEAFGSKKATGPSSIKPTPLLLLGPASPPPTSPLPAVPFAPPTTSMTASSSNDDAQPMESDSDDQSLDAFDELFTPAVDADAGRDGDAGDVPSSPESNVAGKGLRVSKDASLQTAPVSQREDVPDSGSGHRAAAPRETFYDE